MKIRHTVLAFVALAGLINPASAGVWQFTEDFESPAPAGWFTGGGAGFDFNRGLAHQGNGNAWVRFTQGWNSVNRWVPSVPQNADCSAQTFIRVSPAGTGGYFSITGGHGGVPRRLIKEMQLGGPLAGPPKAAKSKVTLELNSRHFVRVFGVGGVMGERAGGL